MTQENKELLLKDLSARLPYGVNVDIKYSKLNGSSLRLRICSEGMLPLNTDLLGLFQEEEIYLKPYFRPMSSMTEEERKEIEELIKSHLPSPDGIINNKGMDNLLFSVSSTSGYLIDWLNAHHFDYCGLIEKGLAIEVTNEHNPYKK